MNATHGVASRRSASSKGHGANGSSNTARAAFWGAALAGAALLVPLASPAPAWACGGLFCDHPPPTPAVPRIPTVDQSSEDILFQVDPDAGRVRAIITIQYEGDADNFSWILPVNSVPEVSFTTDLVFTQLRSVTDVTFSAPAVRRNCVEPDVIGGEGGGDWGWADASEAEPRADSAPETAVTVAVLASGQTGPYDYVVLQSSDTAALIAWLVDNHYVVPPTVAPLMDHYTLQNMPFVAVKLQKTARTGDILPIVLDMEEPEPCVPIVLTQVAAQPDMPIRIWVAGPSRAVPRNWFHVEPNWMRLNWASPGADSASVHGVVSYDSLISRAVDAGAGRSFVTEFAGTATQAATSLGSLALGLDTIAQGTSASGIVSALASRLGVFTPSIISLLSDVLPMPAEARSRGITPEEFYTQSWRFPREYGSIEVDTALVAAAFRAQLTDPLREAQGWLAGTWLTRLYTRISPEEMTRDPFFVFSDQWPAVNRGRSAQQVEDCDGTSQVQSRYIEVMGGLTYLDPAFYRELWAQHEPSLPWATAVVLEVPGEAPFPLRAEDVAFADHQLGMLSAALVTADLEPAGPWRMPDALRPGDNAPSLDGANAGGGSGGIGAPSSPGSSGGCRHAEPHLPVGALALLALLALARRRG